MTLKETLDGIDNGSIELKILVPPDFCGYPEYLSDNGWKFQVFDDCGCWDYFEWVEDPTGRRIDFPMLGDGDELTEEQKLVRYWGPSNMTPWGY